VHRGRERDFTRPIAVPREHWRTPASPSAGDQPSPRSVMPCRAWRPSQELGPRPPGSDNKFRHARHAPLGVDIKPSAHVARGSDAPAIRVGLPLWRASHQRCPFAAEPNVRPCRAAGSGAPARSSSRRRGAWLTRQSAVLSLRSGVVDRRDRDQGPRLASRERGPSMSRSA